MIPNTTAEIENEIKSKINDLLGTADSKKYSQSLNRDSIVIVTPQTMTNLEKIAEMIIKSGKKPICLFLGRKSVGKATKMLRDKGIICLNDLESFKRNL